MGPKWPKQAAFYFLDEETINLWGINRTKNLGFGCLISEDSKQSLGLVY